MTITSEEMRGILKGKCLPGDLRVNEEISDYLARKLADQQAVIDPRNGECDQLIKELAALRANIKTAESYTDDADLKLTIDLYDDADDRDNLQVAMWLKELRRRREKPATVAVPDELLAAIELLRLNSGSKPFIVKLPEPDVYEVNGTRFYDRLKETDVIKAIKAAGGEIAE